jgi:hypothetical protein
MLTQYRRHGARDRIVDAEVMKLELRNARLRAIQRAEATRPRREPDRGKPIPSER